MLANRFDGARHDNSGGCFCDLSDSATGRKVMTGLKRSSPMDIIHAPFVRVGPLSELRRSGSKVVSSPGGPVLVIADGEDVIELDNRCPHMAFPLHRGSIEDGILTCHWHHARFDLASGCTFHLWADDVPRYPIEIRGEEVWVLSREPRDDVAHWKHRLKEGMQQYIGLVMGKATLALLHRGVQERDIVRQAALFGTCYRDD